MICNMCRTGADLLSRVQDLDPKYRDSEGYEVFRTDAIEVGKQLHHHCDGKYSCDCQHRDQLAEKSVQRK